MIKLAIFLSRGMPFFPVVVGGGKEITVSVVYFSCHYRVTLTPYSYRSYHTYIQKLSCIYKEIIMYINYFQGLLMR